MLAPAESAQAQRVRRVRGAPLETKRARRVTRIPPDPCAGNAAPVADAGSAKAGEAGVPVPFDGYGSFDADGSIEFYQWSFGDGSTAYGEAVTHVYEYAGWYSVTLTVTDDCGTRSAEALAAVTVSEPDPCAGSEPPVADAGADRTAEPGQVVSFDGRASYDPDGPVGSYMWDFGDGQTGYGSVVAHAFSVEGEYTVTLTVTNEDECGADDSHQILVNVWAAGEWTAEFTISPNPVELNELVTFTAVALPEQVLAYSWSFDGPWECEICSGQVKTGRYSQVGSFAVSLTVIFRDSPMLSSEQTVVVEQGLTLLGKLEGFISIPRGIAFARSDGGDRLTVWAVGDPGMLVTADVSDPENPRILGSRQLPANVNDVATNDTVVAVAGKGYGFYLFDSNDPINLDHPLDQYDTFAEDGSSAFGVALAGNTLYVTKGWDGLSIYDVSDPTNPQLHHTLADLGYVGCIIAENGRLFVADDATGGGRVPNIKVFDVSVSTDPVHLGTVVRGGTARTLDLAVLGSMLGIAMGGDGAALFDISNPAVPEWLATIPDIGDGTRGVALIDENLYVSQVSMVSEIDVSDPRNPRRRENVSVGNYTFELQVVDGLIYAGFGQGVVTIISP